LNLKFLNELAAINDRNFKFTALGSESLLRSRNSAHLARPGHEGFASIPSAAALVCCTMTAYIQGIYLHGEGRMIVEFRKWGNSLAVRIPKSFADAINASDGKRAELTIKNGTLVLQPLAKSKRKPRYTLDELLAGMTRDNVPQEITWGPPRGNEAW
jgi:antitoxin MazE